MSEKSYTVLAIGSLHSFALPFPLTPTLFMRLLSSKSYDPGKCLEIRHRGSMQPLFLPLQLAAAGISAAHQHITTQCSTDQSAFLVHSTLPGLFGKGSRAQPLAKQPS